MLLALLQCSCPLTWGSFAPQSASVADAEEFHDADTGLPSLVNISPGAGGSCSMLAESCVQVAAQACVLCAGLLQEQAVSQFLHDLSGAVQGLAAETHLLRERCAQNGHCWMCIWAMMCGRSPVSLARAGDRHMRGDVPHEPMETCAGWAIWRRMWRRSEAAAAAGIAAADVRYGPACPGRSPGHLCWFYAPCLGRRELQSSPCCWLSATHIAAAAGEADKVPRQAIRLCDHCEGEAATWTLLTAAARCAHRLPTLDVQYQVRGSLHT